MFLEGHDGLVFHVMEKGHEFEIVAMEVMPDHIHLLIDCARRYYIPEIVKTPKGNTARFLFKEHPELKERLWGVAEQRSSFGESVY